VDGLVSWWSIKSANEDLEVVFENSQQRRYGKFSRHCATIRETRWIGKNIRKHHVYDGTGYLRNFLVDLEDKVEVE
jgi:hypothetical protein